MCGQNPVPAGALFRAFPLQGARPRGQASDPAEPRASALECNKERSAIPRCVSNPLCDVVMRRAALEHRSEPRPCGGAPKGKRVV